MVETEAGKADGEVETGAVTEAGKVDEEGEEGGRVAWVESGEDRRDVLVSIYCSDRVESLNTGCT